MSEIKQKTDEVTNYFWDISTKGQLRAVLTEDIKKLNVRHVVAPTDVGYASVFMYCNLCEYRTMRDYICDLESSDMKVVNLTRLKPEDVAIYSKYLQFSQPFANELVEYHKVNK